MADVVEFLETNGSNRAAWIYENIIYKIGKRLPQKNIIYFSCKTPGCFGKIHTDSNYVIKKAPFGHLQHGDDRVQIQKLRFWDQLRRRAKTESTAPSVIYDQELIGRPMEVTSQSPLSSMERNMNRWRRSTYPTFPRNIQELHHNLISEEHKYLGLSLVTETEVEKVLYRGMVGDHSLLFISGTVTPTLTAENCVLNIDATFKAAPNLTNVRQFLTIMAPIRETALPVAYIIMTSKCRRHYEDIFRRLLEIVPSMNPSHIITDFEQGLQSAVRTIFPDSRIVGCWFHYAQALVRRAKKLPRTVRSIRRNQDIINMAKALALLPANSIEAGFEFLVRYSNGDQRIRPFLDYIRDQWIPIRDQVSVFNVPRRTNNDIEAYHRHIMRHMGGDVRSGARPNPWRFLSALQKIELSAANTYTALNTGNRSTWSKRKTFQRNDAAIRSRQASLNVDSVQSIEEFLKGMKYRTPLNRGNNVPANADDDFQDIIIDPDEEENANEDADDPLPIGPIQPNADAIPEEDSSDSGSVSDSDESLLFGHEDAIVHANSDEDQDDVPLGEPPQNADAIVHANSDEDQDDLPLGEPAQNAEEPAQAFQPAPILQAPPPQALLPQVPPPPAPLQQPVANRCSICLTNQANRFTPPCGHVGVCGECADELTDRGIMRCFHAGRRCGDIFLCFMFKGNFCPRL